MKQFLLSLLAAPALLSAGTLQLMNDTDYDLRAVISTQDGKRVGEVNIPAHSQDSWASPGEEGGLTPEGIEGTPAPMPSAYSVTWYCGKGEQFSSCDEVDNQSTVSANGCPGNQQCGMGLSLPQ